MDKIIMRQQLKEVRAGLDPVIKQEWDSRIIKHIETLCNELSLQSLLLYAPIGSEPDLTGLQHFCKANAIVLAFPKCLSVQGEMAFYAVPDISRLKKQAYCIPEPDLCDCSILTSFERSACIVPALGMDKYGYRIGYGGGYYDRFLKDYHGVTIGVCYESLMVEELPREPHDLKMDYIVTEKGSIPLLLQQRDAQSGK